MDTVFICYVAFRHNLSLLGGREFIMNYNEKIDYFSKSSGFDMRLTQTFCTIQNISKIFLLKYFAKES